MVVISPGPIAIQLEVQILLWVSFNVTVGTYTGGSLKGVKKKKKKFQCCLWT